MRMIDKGELFCSVCFTHDSFFEKDGCPNCYGNGRCTRYEDLTLKQKIIARNKLDVMTKKKRIEKIKSL